MDDTTHTGHQPTGGHTLFCSGVCSSAMDAVSNGSLMSHGRNPCKANDRRRREKSSVLKNNTKNDKQTNVERGIQDNFLIGQPQKRKKNWKEFRPRRGVPHFGVSRCTTNLFILLCRPKTDTSRSFVSNAKSCGLTRETSFKVT